MLICSTYLHAFVVVQVVHEDVFNSILSSPVVAPLTCLGIREMKNQANAKILQGILVLIKVSEALETWSRVTLSSKFEF